MKFYQHWIGDYQKATRRLSMLEHGAYRLLLDEYYSSEQPLPANAMQLHRICSAFADDEQVAVQSVLQQFFTLTENGWVHSRAEEEIDKSRQVSEKRREAANRKWEKHANADASALQMDMQSNMQNGCYPQPQPQPDLKPESKSKTVCPEPPAASVPAVISLPLIGNASHLISQSQIDEWQSLFPAVDVLSELRKMIAWLRANPANKKTPSGINRFIVRWLSKEQDKGGRNRMIATGHAAQPSREMARQERVFQAARDFAGGDDQ